MNKRIIPKQNIAFIEIKEKEECTELTKETKYLQMSHVFAYLLVILLIGILTDLLLIYGRKKLFRYVN
jgi:hypothetical protein